MSLECRILRKNGDDQIYYYCRNSGVTPTEISLCTDPAEIPKGIEHYFKKCKIMTIGPYMAAFLGIQEKLYPNFPKCNHPKFKDTNCIADSCQFAPGGDWTKCPYFKQESERNSNS
jgi:hypothetical protein